MERPQLNSVDEVADFVAGFLRNNEQEVGVAINSIKSKRINGAALCAMSAKEIEEQLQLPFGLAKNLEQAWL